MSRPDKYRAPEVVSAAKSPHANAMKTGNRQIRCPWLEEAATEAVRTSASGSDSPSRPLDIYGPLKTNLMGTIAYFIAEGLQFIPAKQTPSEDDFAPFIGIRLGQADAVLDGRVVDRLRRGVDDELKRLDATERAGDLSTRRAAAELLGSLYQVLLSYHVSPVSVEPGVLTLSRNATSRKHQGAFFTPPELVSPTVRRTLSPLFYDTAGLRPPEQLLELRIVDPAMGTGAFLLGALQEMTSVVVRAIHAHERIGKDGFGACVSLAGERWRTGDSSGGTTFDVGLEQRVLREVASRCLYGVDLDPLAVQLARISLWILVGDRSWRLGRDTGALFAHLEQGNSLVGCPLSSLSTYPVGAWDRVVPRPHASGHVRQLEALRKRRREVSSASFSTERLDETLRRDVQRLSSAPDKGASADVVQRLRGVCDRWCALWFWPLDKLDVAPSMIELQNGSSGADRVVRELREKPVNRFFHWDIEFPEVMLRAGGGFDAVVGNPPWDTMQWESRSLFMDEPEPVKNVDNEGRDDGLEAARRTHWRQFYADLNNYVRRARGDVGREGSLAPAQFAWQGTGKLYSYKLFVELSRWLLRPGGQMGLIVPSALYTDNGSRELRRLLFEHSRVDWLFSFENRRQIFDIDGRFKFCVIIASAASPISDISVAFMHQSLSDWSREPVATISYPVASIPALSPSSLSLLEIQHHWDLDILSKMRDAGTLMGEDGPDTWGVRYRQGDFNITSRAGLFMRRPAWESRGYRRTKSGVWEGPDGDRAVPLYEGRMIEAFEFEAKGWVSGKGRRAVWRRAGKDGGVGPQLLMDERQWRDAGKDAERQWKLLMMNVGSATNERTMLVSLGPAWPTSHSVGVLTTREPRDELALVAVLNSFVYDWALRLRMGGLNLSWFVLAETILPPRCEALRTLGATLHRPGTPLSEALAHERALDIDWSSPLAWRRLRAMTDAIVAALFGLSTEDLMWILRDCQHPTDELKRQTFTKQLDPKGFWRVDRHLAPDQRLPAMTLAAFEALGAHIEGAGGDVRSGIRAYVRLTI